MGAVSVVVLAAAVGCCATAAAGRSLRPARRKGMCWGHGKTGFYNHLYNYSSAAANASLVALHSTGANSVQIETAWYVDDCNATTLHPEPYTPSDSSLRSAIDMAHSLGMETMINAHIEVSCKYDNSCSTNCGGRTDIDFGDNTAMWDAWFASYTAFIVHHAQLCEHSEGCGLLAVHVELQEIGHRLTDIGDRWAAVIAAARKHFSGELTASCNGSPGISGGQALNISYWHLLDYVGIDTFPAVPGNPVRASDVSAAFETLLRNLSPLLSSSTGHSQPRLLFTQVGYPSCTHCGEKGALRKYPSVDEHCQAQAYTGILDVLLSTKYAAVVAGLYFWNWLPCTEASLSCAVGPGDNGESPQDKAAQNIVRQYYSTNSGQLRTKTDDDPAMSVLPSICHQSVMAEACNLNGKVGQDGKCKCLAAWTGPTCGELALQPAKPTAGLHSQSSLSAWGGAVAFDRSSKRWVMFGNELAGGCGINSWEANSRIVRASTADLDKPFVVEEVVLPAFSSEPSLARLGDEWLLYSIGNSSSTRPPRSDCKDGYTPKAPPPNGTGGNFIGFVPVSVRSVRNITASSKGWTLNSTFGNGDFNPAPWVFPNGTTLLMWRHLARVHMVRAPSIGGPFAFNGSDSHCAFGVPTSHVKGCRWWHLFPPAIDQRGVEDPFIFTQPDPPLPASSDHGASRNGSSSSDCASVAVTFHALFHDHKSFGGHAYSRDGVSWTYSAVAPFSNNVSFVDGSIVSMQRRERPHLIFDTRGYISHLINGVQPPPTAQKAPPAGAQNDYVYTSVQPVRVQPS